MFSVDVKHHVYLLESPLSLPTRQTQSSPPFIHIVHPSTPPASVRKQRAAQYVGSNISTDEDENVLTVS